LKTTGTLRASLRSCTRANPLKKTKITEALQLSKAQLSFGVMHRPWSTACGAALTLLGAVVLPPAAARRHGGPAAAAAAAVAAAAAAAVCPGSDTVLPGHSIYKGGVLAATLNVSNEAACCASCHGDYHDECLGWEWIDVSVVHTNHNCDIMAKVGPPTDGWPGRVSGITARNPAPPPPSPAPPQMGTPCHSDGDCQAVGHPQRIQRLPHAGHHDQLDLRVPFLHLRRRLGRGWRSNGRCR